MKYENLTREELLVKVNELDADLNNEKYGLYFDRTKEPENVVKECLKKVPILVHDKTKDILNLGPENLLIEGDNYHALFALNEIAKESFVDVIYIDPPYNRGRGEDDLTYNDNYVDSEDGYKHTKWLTSIEKRLELAKKLLKDTGVIFISIDENEAANLELLCNRIFGEVNKIFVLPRVIKKGGKSTTGIAKSHDTIIIYAKNIELSSLNKVIVDDDASKNLTDEYVKERGKYKLTQTLDYDSLQYSEIMDYEIDINGEKFYPGGSKEMWEERHAGNHKKTDWVWRWSKKLFDWGYKNGFVVVKNGIGRKRIYTKTYANAKIKKKSNDEYYVERVEDSKPYDSLYFTDTRFSNDNAKKELDKFKLGSTFKYPKPSALIKEFIKMTDTSKNAVVMDFYAGSGTTAQAVLDLNEEDGGARRFILCTNNENNIMRDTCYPRIKTVVTGIRKDGTIYSNGRKATVRYFNTGFVNRTDYKEQDIYDLSHEIDGLLCISEQTFETTCNNDTYSIYLDDSRMKCVGIFKNSDENYFDELLEKMYAIECQTYVLYYFSQNSDIDSYLERRAKDILKNIIVKTMPSDIYSSYVLLSLDI